MNTSYSDGRERECVCVYWVNQLPLQDWMQVHEYLQQVEGSTTETTTGDSSDVCSYCCYLTSSITHHMMGFCFDVEFCVDVSSCDLVFHTWSHLLNDLWTGSVLKQTQESVENHGAHTCHCCIRKEGCVTTHLMWCNAMMGWWGVCVWLQAPNQPDFHSNRLLFFQFCLQLLKTGSKEGKEEVTLKWRRKWSDTNIFFSFFLPSHVCINFTCCTALYPAPQATTTNWA